MMQSYGGRRIVSLVLISVISWSHILTSVDGVSYSTVTVVKKELNPSLAQKASTMINIPAVPEFPKIVSKPGKNPVNVQQQQYPSQQYHITNNQPQQQQQQIPSTSTQTSNNLGTPVNLQQNASQSLAQYLLDKDLGSKDLPSTSSSDTNMKDKEKPQIQQQYANFHENFFDINKGKGQVQNQGHQSVSKNESITVINREPPIISAEKIQQEPSNDFMGMPPHVLHILSVLGSGGSLAQASKPEKDGTGSGFTTANAIGYATGDNANVNASVSNKMEVNTQTVILTESASASASSTSNGTAFSQATLQSNGYASNMGGWPAGPGWSN